MRTARLRGVLLEALAAAGAVQAGCTPPSPGPAATPSVEIPPPAPPAASVVEAPAPAPSSTPGPSPTPTEAPYTKPAESAADCADGFRNVLRDLRPARPFDYAELRQRHGSGDDKTLVAHGNVCATAADPATCHRELKSPAASGFGSACHPGHCDFYLVVTDASGVQRFPTPADVVRFAGPIDTPGEAALVAFANRHWVLGCDAPSPVRSGKGWTLTLNQMVEECPVVTADVSLAIGEDGAVRVAGTKNRKQSGACVGRRPPGLTPASSRAASWVGRYLAEAAHLEAASVPAFERLGEELAALGAPAALGVACARAAADERRHARRVKRLARRYSASVLEVAVAEAAPRAAAELAVDNAVEGCVRETFGAAIGWHQAENAQDPEVRSALRRIARDEMRHAALAWRIAAWLEPKLDAEQAGAVRRARRAAIAALREELRVEPPAPAAALLGLPSAAHAIAVCDALERTLWA